MSDNRIEALAYVDKSIDNVADMPPEMIWENREVIQMLEDIRSLLVTGQIMPAEFQPTKHVCEECPTCGVHGGTQLKCCGCYDGVCCQPTEPGDDRV